MPSVRMLVRWTAILPLLGAQSQSVSSCGASGDHFSDVSIALSPDPIEKGKPFSFVLTGTLDEAITAGSADVDVEVSGLVKKSLKSVTPFTFAPGIASGTQSLKVGPVSLPHVPGSIKAAGTIKLTNAKKEAVACIKLNLDVPALEADVAERVNARADELVSDVKGCSQPADHLKGLTVTDNDDVTTVTGSLDEAVLQASVDVDVKLKLAFFSIPVKMTIPISYAPGIAKGDLKVTLGPAEDHLELTKPEVGVSVSGTVKVNDDKSEEITCFEIASTPEDMKPIVV